MRTVSTATDQTRRLFLALPVASLALYALRQHADTGSELHVKEVMQNEARALIAAGAWVVDVRGRAAYEAQHLAGAVLAPLSDLQRAIPTQLAAAKLMPIVVYCGDGVRSGPAATAALNSAGYALAVNLRHGLEGWVAAGLPVVRGGPKAG